MAEKEFKKISWEEWLQAWEENDKLEVAISLLHIGADVSFYNYCNEIEGQFKRIKFYLGIIESSTENQIARVAYQIVVHKLLNKLTNLLQDALRYSRPKIEVQIDGWQAIIRFFANKRFLHVWDEPYRSDIRLFAERLYSHFFGTRYPSQELEKALYKEKTDMLRFLVNVGAWDYIERKEDFDIIPVLKEEIVSYCWGASRGCTPGLKRMNKQFPLGKEQWMSDLDNPYSLASRIALTHAERDFKALLSLLIKQKVSYPNFS